MSLDILHTLQPESLHAAVSAAGVWGPLLYVAVIALSVVISQIPGAPLAVVAGTLWPPLWAGVYTVVGGFSGALIAYGLGRTVGTSIVKSLTGKTLTFSNEDQGRTLGWLIFMTRLVPVFSFDLVSYGAGIAGLSLPVYASATLFGMVPSTLLLTFMGDCIQFEPAVMPGWGMPGLIALCVILFAAVPMLAHRYNWLNLRAIVSWE